ncbi:MAG: YkgJ family cysteine cluster protein, partial [Candidatus Electrothrix sp. AR3]|nr:YkgJ family cysteine cluster protein [Candidatus Electrothrix sp. AR3]
YVWLSKKDLKQMAGAIKMDMAIFSRKYVRKVEGKLSLRENIINGEHFCCFLDPIDLRCTIYANRPQQCKTFPFWEIFKTEYGELFLECPGIFLK